MTFNKWELKSCPRLKSSTNPRFWSIQVTSPNRVEDFNARCFDIELIESMGLSTEYDLAGGRTRKKMNGIVMQASGQLRQRKLWTRLKKRTGSQSRKPRKRHTYDSFVCCAICLAIKVAITRSRLELLQIFGRKRWWMGCLGLVLRHPVGISDGVGGWILLPAIQSSCADEEAANVERFWQ